MIFAQEITDSIPETEQVMPPAGAPWWAFIVTAAAAVIAVIIANSASKAREHESWRREQLLDKILEVLHDCARAEQLFSMLAKAKVEQVHPHQVAQYRAKQLANLQEITSIGIPFRRHMELLYVMSSPAFSEHIFNFLGLLTENTGLALKMISQPDYDNKGLAILCDQISISHAEMIMLAQAELRVVGFRSRFRNLRMIRESTKIHKMHEYPEL
ncbi:hypothetical protein [Rhodococcus erythropolis]|uniref:Uncharacterized protein n=1 Tax=Rhodococcus erythropolis TaxID=1833 RepID=A0AAX3ZZS4_RHOER|nr:hypothetical protein [Rhodococcus erythropolis]WMN01684.1 hypothetical protein QIE55_30685 [Rhodococcus erythropolis]